MTIDEREILAKQPITWTGDLKDDCTAKWAGLMLRAEWMDDDRWWWAVYDMQRDEIIIENSNEDYSDECTNGEMARKKAENVAANYISVVTNEIAAKYIIAETFKITGRGLVFAGYITEGFVSSGDTIEFIAFKNLQLRRITGIELMTKSQPDKVNTGLVVECTSEAEIDKLRNWNPNNVLAVIYKTGTTRGNLLATNGPFSQARPRGWWQKLFGSK